MTRSCGRSEPASPTPGNNQLRKKTRPLNGQLLLWIDGRILRPAPEIVKPQQRYSCNGKEVERRAMRAERKPLTEVAEFSSGGVFAKLVATNFEIMPADS